MKLRAQRNALLFLGWNNCIKVNQDKFHLFIFDRNIYDVDICNGELSSAGSENVCGTKIDKLSFE